MPELPEVEIIRRGLKAKILGETIVQVNIFRQQSIGYPEPKKFSAFLTGQTFTDVSRRGKYLLLHLNSKKNTAEALLVIHLRMSGRLLLLEKNGKKQMPSKFLRVEMKLKSARTLSFEDMRVFGRLSYVYPSTHLNKIIPSFSQLGIEPLENISANQLQLLLKNKRQAIKSTLLDQTIIVGIGNIYADEVLFQAGIHPLMPAGDITIRQAKRLGQIIPDTLWRAIERGGSSIKDFVDSEGVNGNYQHEALVYGRTNKPCRVCKSTIMRLKISGRSAHFCPNCQKH